MRLIERPHSNNNIQHPFAVDELMIKEKNNSLLLPASAADLVQFSTMD